MVLSVLQKRSLGAFQQQVFDFTQEKMNKVPDSTEFDDLELNVCEMILHMVFPKISADYLTISANPLRDLHTPASLLLYLTDLAKYGTAASKKRGTVYVLGNTGAGKSSLVNTFQEYVNNPPSEEPVSKLTGNSEELLRTKILELSANLDLETTEKLNVEVKVSEGLKLVSLIKDGAVETQSMETQKLGIKMIDFGGHTEYHSCASLFIDSDGVFVICADSTEFTEENAEDKYLSLIGTYIELISGKSDRSGNLPKVQIVATKVDKSCDKACEKLLEQAKAHIASLSSQPSKPSLILVDKVLQTNMEFVTHQILTDLYQTFYALCTSEEINEVSPRDTPANWYRTIETAQGMGNNLDMRSSSKMTVQKFAEIYRTEKNAASISQDHVKDLSHYLDLLRLMEANLGSEHTKREQTEEEEEEEDEDEEEESKEDRVSEEVPDDETESSEEAERDHTEKDERNDQLSSKQTEGGKSEERQKQEPNRGLENDQTLKAKSSVSKTSKEDRVSEEVPDNGPTEAIDKVLSAVFDRVVEEVLGEMLEEGMEQKQSLDEAKVVLRYFAGFKEILWFDKREGIKEIVVTQPMELIKSMRTVISHKPSANTTEACQQMPTTGNEKEKGLISFEEFQTDYNKQEEDHAFSAEELWHFFEELGLAYRLKAFEPSYTMTGTRELFLFPCLVTSQTEKEVFEVKHREMETSLKDSSKSAVLQYNSTQLSSTKSTDVFQDLVKLFVEKFLWNGRGGKILNAYNQEVEGRKLGVTSGFHGVLRWSANEEEDSDELFEFLMLHHMSAGFQQSVSAHLKGWGIGASELASSVLKNLDKEFLPGVTEEPKSSACQKEEEPEKCPICWDSSFTEPVFTDCAHMFCWPCLIRHRSSPKLKDRYKCSICRKSYATVTSVNTKGNYVHSFTLKIFLVQEVPR